MRFRAEMRVLPYRDRVTPLARLLLAIFPLVVTVLTAWRGQLGDDLAMLLAIWLVGGLGALTLHAMLRAEAQAARAGQDSYTLSLRGVVALLPAAAVSIMMLPVVLVIALVALLGGLVALLGGLVTLLGCVPVALRRLLHRG